MWPFKGFTLLELITVLAIISLLMTISYASYTHHILKTHRVSAQIALLDLASAMERYYALYNTYGGATLTNLEINAYTHSRDYQLQINDATFDTYLLTATPQQASAKDPVCGILSLNHLGIKNISGTGKVSDCW